jgi:hypothetical protein
LTEVSAASAPTESLLLHSKIPFALPYNKRLLLCCEDARLSSGTCSCADLVELMHAPARPPRRVRNPSSQQSKRLYQLRNQSSYLHPFLKVPPASRARVLKSQVLPTPSSAHTPSHHAPSRSSPPISDAPPHTTPPSSPSLSRATPDTLPSNAHRETPPPPPPDTTTDAHDNARRQSAQTHASDRSPDAQAPSPLMPLSPRATPALTQATPLTAQTPRPNRRQPPSAAAPPSAPTPRPEGGGKRLPSFL